MTRGIGELAPIQDAIPEWLAVIVALITQLGDIWFLALVLSLLYWFDVDRRDDIAMVAGVWLAAMGLYKGLKEVFSLPRPDEPLLDPELLPWAIQHLYEATAMASGYGFPSGHAVNTTVVYFALAHVLTVSTRRRRFVGAAAIVTAVSFSRLALGVHYLVDVVVGVGVGLLLLSVAKSGVDRRPGDAPTVTFGLAILFGLFFVVTSGVDEDAVFVLAASLGTFAGWQLIVLGRRLVEVDRPSAAVRPVTVRGGLAALALTPLVAPFEYFPLVSVYTIGGAAGLIAAGVITLPVLRHSERARGVGAVIRFWLLVALGGVRRLLRPASWKRAFRSVRSYVTRLRD